jgi:hypothetical protein
VEAPRPRRPSGRPGEDDASKSRYIILIGVRCGTREWWSLRDLQPVTFAVCVDVSFIAVIPSGDPHVRSEIYSRSSSQYTTAKFISDYV